MSGKIARGTLWWAIYVFFSWFVGAGLNRMEVLGMCCIFVGGDSMSWSRLVVYQGTQAEMGGGMMSLGGMTV